MTSTPTNGAPLNGTPHASAINPVEAAHYALAFLGRVSFTRQERAAFDASEALLQAIARGQVLLAPPASAEWNSVDGRTTYTGPG